ncbi:DUF4240 domain-containing protein [Roseibium porphyridii]|uniref:DUF4240 domain-containing protein n=2 Tax=Stappiaceae TaxID=2821832 RepID=A0ABY8F878_9HYPH|nr:DUF4240 domain-containing protein [Roseibium sp. KMA01]WFE90729.1 DUF4240 domain-containing protein [Roseibium sp. KMA01]
MTNEIVIAGDVMFRPRFDNVSRDCERLMERVVELTHQGQLQRQEGKSLFDLYIKDAERRLIDAFFARELFEEIETHYCYTFEIAFSWPHADMRSDLEKLISAGQGQRAIRIWRHYLALIKQHYWELIAARNRGFKKAPHLNESEAEQRVDWDRWTGRVPEYKADLLAMMDTAKECFERAGASPAQFERLASERDEVAAEERRGPSGKVDPRKIDEDVFWEIVGLADADGLGGQVEQLVERLAGFKATSIKSFDTLLQEKCALAYREDVWALAYLLNDGCSDDDFEGFRSWLLLQGRDVFEAVLTDPDAFPVSRFQGKAGSAMDLRMAPMQAFEMRQGKALSRKAVKVPNVDLVEFNDTELADRFPRVSSELARIR